MQAAQRSQALQKKNVEMDCVARRSAIDIIQDAIQEFKSHCRFPYPDPGPRETGLGPRQGAGY
jgi:hypothetical protein